MREKNSKQSLINTIKQEATLGRIDSLESMIKNNVFPKKEISEITDMVVFKFAEKGHKEAFLHLNSIYPISKDINNECAKIAFKNGHMETVSIIKQMIQKQKSNEYEMSLTLKNMDSFEKSNFDEPNKNFDKFMEKEVKDYDKHYGPKALNSVDNKNAEKPYSTASRSNSIEPGIVINSGYIKGKVIQNGVERDPKDFNTNNEINVNFTNFSKNKGFLFRFEKEQSFDEFIKKEASEYEDKFKINNSETGLASIRNGVFMNKGSFTGDVTMINGKTTIIENKER
jgi:hypothetical protein